MATKHKQNLHHHPNSNTLYLLTFRHRNEKNQTHEPGLFLYFVDILQIFETALQAINKPMFFHSNWVNM